MINIEELRNRPRQAEDMALREALLLHFSGEVLENLSKNAEIVHRGDDECYYVKGKHIMTKFKQGFFIRFHIMPPVKLFTVNFEIGE